MRRHDVTTVRHRLPITLCCVVIPSPAPFDSSITLLLEVSSPSDDRSTQDPPPPADEARVLRVTLNVCLPFSLGDFGGSLPPEAPYIKSADPVVPMPIPCALRVTRGGLCIRSRRRQIAITSSSSPKRMDSRAAEVASWWSRRLPRAAKATTVKRRSRATTHGRSLGKATLTSDDDGIEEMVPSKCTW